MGRRGARAVPGRRPGHRPAARPAHGRARQADATEAVALRGASARGARDRPLHRRPGAGDLREGAAHGDLHGARRGLSAPAHRPQRRGDTRLLPAHDGLGLRHRAPLPLAPPGPGLPVRARPPPGPRRHRLGARTRGDPHHGRARGQGAAAPAQASTTPRVTDAIRTPDPLLEGLSDFPYTPSYRTADGLRLAHVDEGDGAPVVMWHGEPTWGYLWRHVLPPVRDAGHRVVLPDLVGFGRSDKPMERDWYSYDRHVATAATLLEDLDLH